MPAPLLDEVTRAELTRIRRDRMQREQQDEHQERDWPKPKPLPNGLARVEPFNLDFMPVALKPWIADVADRLQCPPDYVAVPAIVGLGSVIGCRVGIKPQRNTDWIEVPNIWGGFIGRPGMLKSPAMQEALKPLHRLETEAAKENEVAQFREHSSRRHRYGRLARNYRLHAADLPSSTA
jgi:Protein of unknown function (DUF3987)